MGGKEELVGASGAVELSFSRVSHKYKFALLIGNWSLRFLTVH